MKKNAFRRLFDPDDFTGRAQEEMKNQMSNAEFIDFLTDLRKRYGDRNPNVRQVLTNDPSQAMYGKTYDGQEVVQSPKLKDITLHEYGHAFDEGAMKRAEHAKRFKEIGGTVGGIGSIGATVGAVSNNADPDAEKEVNPFLMGAGTAAAGAGLTGAGVLLTNRSEDIANRFVKEYMTDELGDAKKAKKWFDESILPSARKTYRNVGAATVGIPLASGLAVAGIGGAVDSHRKRKEENKMNKQANYFMEMNDGTRQKVDLTPEQASEYRKMTSDAADNFIERVDTAYDKKKKNERNAKVGLYTGTGLGMLGAAALGNRFPKVNDHFGKTLAGGTILGAVVGGASGAQVGKDAFKQSIQDLDTFGKEETERQRAFAHGIDPNARIIKKENDVGIRHSPLNKQANEMQDPREELAWLGGASLGLGGAAAIGAKQNMNKQLRQAVEENTKGLPADVKDAYTKASRKAATQEMLSAPKKAFVDGVLHSPGKSLAGLVGGGALATLGYQMHKHDELNKQANSLEEEQAELERLEAKNREAFNAYGAQPHALGPRVALQAATMGGGYFGGAAAGGLLGEALERKSGTKFFKGVGEPIGRFNGKVMGTLGGMLLGTQGQNVISDHLDKKHPERVELRKQHEEAEDRYYEQLNKVVDMEEGTYKQANYFLEMKDGTTRKVDLTPEQAVEYESMVDNATEKTMSHLSDLSGALESQKKRTSVGAGVGGALGFGGTLAGLLKVKNKRVDDFAGELAVLGGLGGLGAGAAIGKRSGKKNVDEKSENFIDFMQEETKRQRDFTHSIDPNALALRSPGASAIRMNKQANYDDILEKQREIVDMQEALAVRRAQIDALAEEAKATGQAYDAQPHASLARLGVLGGATGIGAGVGALVSGARGYGATGALPGAVAGGLAGLAAQPFISNHLDKKHPERVEARAAIEDANRALFETKGRYEDEKSLRDLAVEDAAKAGLEHPSLYAKAVREVGDQFPIREVNSQIQKMREARAILEQQEAELKRLAIDEKKAVIRGATSANDLTEEQVIKEKMKNYQRAEKMNLV